MEAMHFEGSVTGTVFHNEENDFSVITVKSGRTEITATGILPELAIGEQIILDGTYSQHPKYGSQLKITSYQIVLPSDLLGIERFLASGLVRGIKSATAKEIVKHFKEDTFEILNDHPERLMEIKGIGKTRWKMIAESYHDTMNLRLAMVFLTSYGIPSALSAKIARRYGDETEKIIRENPYQLCTDLDGVGFQTADRIAMSLGIDPLSPFRIQAGIIYTLTEQALLNGHCYLPADETVRRACAFLHVPTALIETAIQELSISKQLVCESAAEGIRVYLPWYYEAEEEVARRLHDLLSAVPRGDRQQGDDRIRKFESREGISFSPMQREAILCALEFGVLVITGGPGTGKTTIIRGIISLLQREGPILLCAPTGRAAKRMSEATGKNAKTIHRLLEYTGEEGFAHDESEPLDASCIIVDEMSMVDIMLMRSLLRAINPGTRLILVGDADQLPSVGPGNVLGDILASRVLPAVRLTDIYRQSEESRIVVNAHRINRGEMPLLNGKGTDFFFTRTQSASVTSEVIVGLVKDRLPKYIGCSPEDRAQNIQVLSPMKKGDAGVVMLNRLLQDALNPPSDDRATLTLDDLQLRVGDKVMQTKNDYSIHWFRHGGPQEEEGDGVFNGDIGTITAIRTEEDTLTVLFDDDKVVEYKTNTSEVDNLDLAYAMSIHKSQGSEFPVVIIPVCGGPKMLMTRNLLYTALTRAKNLVVLVGQEQVITDMVNNNLIHRRYTALQESLELQVQ